MCFWNAIPVGKNPITQFFMIHKFKDILNKKNFIGRVFCEHWCFGLDSGASKAH